jgi:phosphate:Na+ symporter
MELSVKDIVFGMVGGLGLFLFGMGMLSDGLKKAAGDRLRRLLAKVTRRPILAYLVGAGVTCLIQSSSATTVMTVGLVNAGLLTLKQAICVVLGANVGTTFTAWLVSGMSIFKITTYALPAVGIGFLFNVLGRRQQTKNWGQVLLGFGILFLGISFMKETFDPLRSHEGARNVLIAVGRMPILAVLAGAVFTMLIQSSSASVAMIQIMAFSGVFGTDWQLAFRVAIPFVLGDDIGTTITAQIAALRTNVLGRRTAMAHTMFNVLGVGLVLPFVYLGLFADMIEAITPVALTRNTVMLHIAIAHSTFKVATSLVFLQAAGLLERIVVKMVRGRPQDIQMQPVTLERHLLATPPVAMEQAGKEIVRMAQTAKDALEDAVAAICQDDRKRLSQVARKEEGVDNFQTEITRYLIELSQRTLSPETANELPVLLHTVNDLERVSDHAVNIAEIAARKIDQRESFSPAAEQEVAQVRQQVSQMFEDVLAAIATSDTEAAQRALGHEEAINQMQVDFRRRHLQRLGEGTCSPIAGLIFVDFVDNMEKIGDHLTNIAQGVLGGLQWRGDGS